MSYALRVTLQCYLQNNMTKEQSDEVKSAAITGAIDNIEGRKIDIMTLVANEGSNIVCVDIIYRNSKYQFNSLVKVINRLGLKDYHNLGKLTTITEEARVTTPLIQRNGEIVEDLAGEKVDELRYRDEIRLGKHEKDDTKKYMALASFVKSGELDRLNNMYLAGRGIKLIIESDDAGTYKFGGIIEIETEREYE